MSRSTRLLNVLQLLRGRRTPITAAAIAHALAVSERTIYRDIAALTAEGASIAGEAGLGYVLKPGFFLPPLMLEAEEAEAVLLGLRYVTQRGDEVLRKAAASTRAKLDAILPPAARGGFDEPLAMPGPVGPQAEGPVPLSVIRLAIRAQTKLAIRYRDAAGVETGRTIWPITVGFLEQARVVGAWCELRQDFRMFRADRILTAGERGRYPGRRALLLQRFNAALARS